MNSAHAPGSLSPLLTVGEVAKLLHVSETSVYRWVEARKVPFFRIEGCVRFCREEVRRFLHTRRVAAIDEYERSKDSKFLVG